MKHLHMNRLLGLGTAVAIAGCASPQPPAPAGAAMSTTASASRPVPVAPIAGTASPAAAAPAAATPLNMLETILTRLAGDKGVTIARGPTGALQLRATGDTAFGTGSASLNPRFTDFLRQLASGLQTYPTLSMKVTGHTDGTGDAQLNQRLSEARAAATIQFLVREGVAAQRLLAEGKGQSEPIASNDSPQGRASNRRVDMLIIELPKQ